MPSIMQMYRIPEESLTISHLQNSWYIVTTGTLIEIYSIVCCTGKHIENWTILILFYRSNRLHFPFMCMYHIPLGILGEHMKRFTNHELEASDLKTFVVFDPDPKQIIRLVSW